ncbi:MAG TPA: hypothetical protein VM307_12795, partial [Egibacteraceae bacterium]|nr:hypothetical protein [Egibacteraceae bacterium]
MSDPVGDGRYEVGPVIVSAPGLTQLTVSCEPETPTPCSPEIPVVQCTEAPPQTHYVLDDDAVTIEG